MQIIKTEAIQRDKFKSLLEANFSQNLKCFSKSKIVFISHFSW